MKKRITPFSLLTACLFVGILLYYISYINYLQTPSADYIGNFRPFIHDIIAHDFSDIKSKILPAYPMLVSAVYRIIHPKGFDPVYTSSLILNFILIMPFLLLTFLLYRNFLSRKTSFIALIFLGTNTYTLFAGLNAELEIFLCFISVLTFYLMQKKSSLTIISAAITSIVKWDAVFIIPSYALSRLLRTKKFFSSAVIGAASALLLLAYIAAVLFSRGLGSNAYVGEIARRGPNIYRFPLDCILAVSGSLQWIGLKIFYGRPPLESALLGLFCLLFGAAVIFLLVYGFKKFLSCASSIKFPLLVYLGGYFFVHMVYQNSKDRYVIPIIWILSLFIFMGIQELITKKKAALISFCDSRLSLKKALLYLILVLLYGLSLYEIADRPKLNIILFAGFIHILAAVFLYADLTSRDLSRRIILPLLLIICTISNINIAFGKDLLDHYSLRRVEFKKAALWFKSHASAHDKILMTETNMAKYYTKMGSKIVGTGALKSTTLNGFMGDMKDMNISYIYIDDFYIRRLLINDKNAFDKKAQLLKQLRDSAEKIDSLHLVKKIKVAGGIEGYLYRFRPER